MSCALRIDHRAVSTALEGVFQMGFECDGSVASDGSDPILLKGFRKNPRNPKNPSSPVPAPTVAGGDATMTKVPSRQTALQVADACCKCTRTATCSSIAPLTSRAPGCGCKVAGRRCTRCRCGRRCQNRDPHPVAGAGSAGGPTQGQSTLDRHLLSGEGRGAPSAPPPELTCPRDGPIPGTEPATSS